MIYHGPTAGAETYFGRLNYHLPVGESVADWLIDISSGRLEPDNIAASRKSEGSPKLYANNSRSRLDSAGRVFTDGNCIGEKGVTTGKVVR